MRSRDERLRDDRDDKVIDEHAPEATGDILGISQVPTGPSGEVHGPVERTTERGGAEDEGHVMPLEDEADLGARDVTRNGRGQTGPETGGHGSTPRRSGATGMDIGE